MAEVAGVALGVGSLIISAIQSYNATKDLLCAFKHAPRKLRDARRQVQMAALAFRKANERLLSHCVDDADAKRMVADLRSPLWRRTDVRSDLATLLGDDQECFKEAAALVLDKLEFLQKRLKSFSMPADASTKVLKQQLRYAFEQSRMDKMLSELMDITQNFTALVTLLLPQHVRVDNTASTTASVCSFSDLEQFRNVERSAEDLYKALGTACNDHSIHHAFIKLNPDCSDRQQTCFTLAFVQDSIPNAQDGMTDSTARSTWLTVQSAFTESTDRLAIAGTVTNLVANRAKRSIREMLSDDDDQKRSRTKHQVRFQLPGSVRRMKQTWSIPAQPSTPAFLNLCKHGKICHHLAKFQGLTLPADESIGYLDLSCGSRHLVYLKPRVPAMASAPAASEMRTLQQLLGQSRSDNVDHQLPLQHRLHLAQRLATAVLHFHATSWLRGAWNSQRILLSEDSRSGSAADAGQIPEPYAMTRIDKSSSSCIPPSATPSQLVVRNRLLFSLGIVLLELAYQRPLEALTIDLDRHNISPEDVPYRTADRLANRVSAKLGANYAELVRKCVHCDFGHGFDLKQPRLQEAFYRSVVCELDTLVKSPSWICASVV